MEGKVMKVKATFLAILGLLALASPASAQWSGCGLGASGAIWTAALVETGSPVGFSTDAQKVGLSVDCNVKYQAFVFGAELNYDWFLGNAKDLGFDAELAAIGKIGILISPASNLYALGGWGRLSHSAFDVDGWKIGLGNEFRVPNSPIYLDLRYVYTTWDLGDVSPMLASVADAHSHEVRLGVKVRFGPGMFGNSGSIFADTEPEPKVVGGDSKIMGKR